jgi:hypothetical protein
VSTDTDKTGRCGKCRRAVKPKYALCWQCEIQREREEAYHEGYIDGLRDARVAREQQEREGAL